MTNPITSILLFLSLTAGNITLVQCRTSFTTSQSPSLWGWASTSNEGERRDIHDIITSSLNRRQNNVQHKITWLNTLNVRGGGAEEEIKSNLSTTSSTSSGLDIPVAPEETKTTENEDKDKTDESLEDKVKAAMLRLGLSPDGIDDDDDNDNMGGKDDEQKEEREEEIEEEIEEEKEEVGVEQEESIQSAPSPQESSSKSTDDELMSKDVDQIIKQLSTEMNVSKEIVTAALGATLLDTKDKTVNVSAARKMIQNELDAIARVKEDCDEVKQLELEGHEKTLCRRALAFADMNLEVARAILQADEDDAKAEKVKEAEKESKKATVNQKDTKQISEKSEQKKQAASNVTTGGGVPRAESGFELGSSSVSAQSQQQQQQQQPPVAPPPAKKEDVVFEATSATIEKQIFESKVPVLLDVYADWCGPCKALTPVLEDMAVRAGGMLRLVKLNTDNERSISGALEVSSLPTVFGIRDGKIVNSFQGMPRSEEFMKSFMMGLFGASDDMTDNEKKKYEELSNKFIKIVGTSGFSFSDREKLQNRMSSRLDNLLTACNGDMVEAEQSAKVLRSLLSNVIADPFELKFRRVNLGNKVIATRIAAYPPAVSILKSAGFTNDEGSPQNTLILDKGKKVVNVARLTVARDSIDKWIDTNVREIASAKRKRQDEIARNKLLEEAEEIEEDDDDADEEEKNKIDTNVCHLKLRLEGKNKIHDVVLKADDPLSSVINALPTTVQSDEEVQITCAARRLIVKSTDSEEMKKTLREHKLTPAASVVIKIGNKSKSSNSEDKPSLKERAAARKSRTKGEHTMQSIGIYAKDDNAKGELIDGGGGVWYEHDVTDDEESGVVESGEGGPEKNVTEEDITQDDGNQLEEEE